MTFPTILSPWYVVQRSSGDCDLQCNEQQKCSGLGELEYFTAQDEGTEFTKDKKRAMLFMALASASRVAEATVSEVRVLYTEDHAKEFDRA